jgi:hypothetical protein
MRQKKKKKKKTKAGKNRPRRGVSKNLRAVLFCPEYFVCSFLDVGFARCRGVDRLDDK